MLTVGAVLAAPAQGSPSADREAVGAGNPAEFPDVAHHSFENGFLSINSNGASILGPWFFTPGAGVAFDTIVSPKTPSRTDHRAAFVGDSASIRTDRWIDEGTWRLRFQSAQQVVGTGPGTQDVDVLIKNLLATPPTQFLAARFEPGDTYEEVVTRPFRIETAGMHRLEFLGSGGPEGFALIDDVVLEPIAEWESPATWGGDPVPTGNETVLIPEGVEVAIAGNRVARNVTVHGELLASNVDGSLTTRFVLVDHPRVLAGSKARFEVGLERARFLREFTLKLTGNNPNAMELPGAAPNTKGLMAINGGEIDMHGEEKTSWTKLTNAPNFTICTAGPGVEEVCYREVEVEELTGWSAGDQIVIAGTTHQEPKRGGNFVEYVDYSEVATIGAVVGNTLHITTDLVHQHNFTNKTFSMGAGPSAKTWTPDQRAEVGMLTHNVKVMGITTATQPTFGGHIMMARDESTTESIGGRGRFSGVELFQMGQMGKLGRYPIHWHLQGNQGAGQYFQESSIHESFNRAVTIHGTESAAVENNVAYRHIGHGFFLEDGSERFNEINGNLGLSTLRPDPDNDFTSIAFPNVHTPYVPLLLSDFRSSFAESGSNSGFQSKSPATFWITNPHNTFKDNVAAGTEGVGFWFALPIEVFLPSLTVPYLLTDDDPPVPLADPVTDSLIEFAGNTAHSCYMGFDMNDGVGLRPVSGGNDEEEEMDELLDTDNDGYVEKIIRNVDWSPSAPAVIQDFTAWACGAGIYTGEGHGDIAFDNAMLLDNNEALQFAGYHEVKNSLIVADAGIGSFTSTSGLRYALRFYHNLKLTDSLVQGFDGGDNSLIRNIAGAQKHLNTNVRGVQFDPLPLITHAGVPDYSTGYDAVDSKEWGFALRDLDGDIEGDGELVSLIGGHPMMRLVVDPTAPQQVPVLNDTVYGLQFDPVTPTVFVSPYIFGHLRFWFVNQHGNPTGNSTDALTVTRRQFPQLSPDFTMNWKATDPVIDPKIQLPVILDRVGQLDDYFEYEIDWSAALASKGPGEIVELKFDDAMAATDRARISLTGLVGVTGITVSANIGGDQQVFQGPESNPAALDSAGGFAWHLDSTSGELSMVFTGIENEDNTNERYEYERTVHIDWD